MLFLFLLRCFLNVLKHSILVQQKPTAANPLPAHSVPSAPTPAALRACTPKCHQLMCYICATYAGNTILRAHYAFIASRNGVAIAELALAAAVPERGGSGEVAEDDQGWGDAKMVGRCLFRNSVARVCVLRVVGGDTSIRCYSNAFSGHTCCLRLHLIERFEPMTFFECRDFASTAI